MNNSALTRRIDPDASTSTTYEGPMGGGVIVHCLSSQLCPGSTNIMSTVKSGYDSVLRVCEGPRALVDLIID